MNEFLDHLYQEFQLPLTNSIASFCLILFVILISPLILRKTKIPSLIVLIISGLLIGAGGFHLVEKNAAVDLFSTVGLLYIMFIAGLDLDLHSFRKYRNKSLFFGFLTFIIPLSLGYPICRYLLGYEPTTSILISSMFSTHTLISYPIVSRLGISKNEAVAIAVGGTILTDTAVLLILAFVVGLDHAGGLGFLFWTKLLIFISLFSLVLFVVVPWFSKWFFRKLESEKHSHYIYVLFVMFFSAFLAKASGLEPIIGAFFAGLALNKLIPHNSVLMDRISFIGNALFIPFFLIGVGMMVDFRFLFEGYWAIVVAFTLIITAITGKWLAAFFTRLAFHFTSSQQNLIFGLSSSHAAATLAVILVGFNAGILDKDVLNGTIILILVTCAVSTLVTEQASKKIALNQKNEDSKALPEFEHVLVPIANFDNLKSILDFAKLIHQSGHETSITLLSVVSENAQAEQTQMLVKDKLEEIFKDSANEKIEVITTIDHHVASGISRVSKELMTTLILQGWPLRLGVIQRLIGQKTENVLHSTDAPVFFCQIMHPFERHTSIRLLIPPLSEHEVGFAFWFSKVTSLASDLNLNLSIYCTKKTQETLEKESKASKRKTHLEFHQFSELEHSDFWNDAADLEFIVVASSREGYLSYETSLMDLPKRMESTFSQNSKVLIYPRQFPS